MKIPFLMVPFLAFLPLLPAQSGRRTIPLPQPRLKGDLSVEEALARRRSERRYSKESLTPADLGQLLWAAQGITDHRGYRTAPSAGALYPLELFVVVGNVENIPAGVYHYEPEGHKLYRKADGDLRERLAALAVHQDWMARASAILVISGVYERTAAKYQNRGQRYVHIEAGHAAQNVYLQAEALGLGTVVVGAFQDEEVQRLLGLKSTERPLLIMPVGR